MLVSDGLYNRTGRLMDASEGSITKRHRMQRTG
ncbi:hypothetical protein EV643_115137 [Kribbella sp. VKM Ac-2527]|uniref:Uncharacterized protein n=1 Tax=Kribbella caucasensis TaxID=2512215 RepID=A0A4R6K7N7_9ACTN|nr:hypothetical protein EV643_115137 [Kribbella sp. VKM Ac-2527]